MDRKFFEKAFSEKRMEKYFKRYDDEEKAMLHYQSNIELAGSFYPCISTFEVVLRNSISRELTILFGREDWYVQFASTPGLNVLNMPKTERQRKKIAPPLNRFRTFRNRVFHHEPISWNMERVTQIHTEMLTVMAWMNKDIPAWITPLDRFEQVCENVEKRSHSPQQTRNRTVL